MNSMTTSRRFGLRLAMDVGADLRNLNEGFGALCFKEESATLKAEGKPTNPKAMVQRRMPGCITVNRHGGRGHEARARDRSGQDLPRGGRSQRDHR
jgi:hypothetical protein